MIGPRVIGLKEGIRIEKHVARSASEGLHVRDDRHFREQFVQESRVERQRLNCQPVRYFFAEVLRSIEGANRIRRGAAAWNNQHVGIAQRIEKSA